MRKLLFLRLLPGLVFVLYVGNLFYVAGDRPWRAPARSPAGVEDEWSGVIHVHSRFSDGSGSVESIARAASQVGARFVILTDHNTTSARAAEGYHDGVLVVVGEERSTDQGHLLILGEAAAGRDAALVAAVVARNGGITVVAHPFGRRAWKGPFPPACTAVEIVNADTAWRDDPFGSLLSSLIALPLLPRAPWNRLSGRPDRNLALLDSLDAVRPVVPIGAVDAHAAIELFGDVTLPFPSYESSFGLIRTHVLLDAAPTGDASHDEALLLRAIASGGVFVAFDGLGESDGFRFEAAAGGLVVRAGGEIAEDRAKISVVLPLPGPTTIRILKDGKVWREGNGPRLNASAGPGVYRAEVYQQRRVLRPWIFSGVLRVTGKRPRGGTGEEG